VVRRPGAFQRLQGWAKRNLPTRESFEGNRYLKPVAHRVLAPALWRFTRRSVPRGVALGMVTGILFPVAQIAIAALIALPFRANIPVAALTTFITNPLTTPLIWAGAYYVGKWTLRLDQIVPGDPVREAATSSWVQWLMSDAAPSIAVGLLIITAASAIGGYFVTKWAWQGWIAHKWRTRHHRPVDGA
jgi:uncharacterized protein